ncbi:MAG TPA: hypothetical protein VGO50_03210 [Pyrinomonadaceae bacterium]|jgi:hypothetical protein|nr:hypothetical protein [Pyrinomonadaceae bacterium]
MISQHKIHLTVEKIKKEVNGKFEGKSKGNLLTDGHFENGRSLHSNQYFFLKRYFQNSANCKKLGLVLRNSLELLQFKVPTTLIGFRNYSSLVLNEVVKSSTNLNFAIIEKNEENYVWQHLPDLNPNLVIVLPIACTFVSFFRLRNFITDYCKSKGLEEISKVNVNFINIFMILEESLKDAESRIIDIKPLDEVDRESVETFDSKLSKIYAPFNWVRITPDSILFNSDKDPDYKVFPLIRLYSKMWQPESCDLCFPGENSTIAEKPLFPTRDNFETPDLIFGFPNFRITENRAKFFGAFSDEDGFSNIILKGNINVNNTNYLTYVRGNEFYLKNKGPILDFFESSLKEILKNSQKIVFITADNKHNSTFLEELSTTPTFRKKSVSILRFQPSNEFVDNFISLYFDEISDLSVKIIYFEDVMSAGKVFKLVSDYIKHARNDNDISQARGVDLAMVLVDRMSLYARDEVVKKLSTSDKEKAEEKLISYIQLNVPIVFPSHLGNPLRRKINHLEGMIKESHLDSLKATIGKNITKLAPKNLPEIGRSLDADDSLHYFPFQSLEKATNTHVYDLYKGQFNKDRMDVLSIHVVHLLNSELAKISEQFLRRPRHKLPTDFIPQLIKKLLNEIDGDLARYFLPANSHDSKHRKKYIESDIVHDMIVKTLCQPPFIYHKEIYLRIFSYCIEKLRTLYSEVETDFIQPFFQFRKLKFYIRRSIDLNSNFIVSKRFIYGIKTQFENSIIKKALTRHYSSLHKLKKRRQQGKISEEFFKAAERQVNYKIHRIKSFFDELLFYYKELIFKNPAISIQMEGLLNSEEDFLLPDQIAHPELPTSKVEELIADPYFHFTGMIKAENIYLFSELKNLHIKKLEDSLLHSEKSNLTVYKAVKQHYFSRRKNDPVSVNAQKLLSKSRHRKSKAKLGEIKQSAINMLLAAGKLRLKSSAEFSVHQKAEGQMFNKEIRDILDSLLNILQPGIPKNALSYAFFVEHRTNEHLEGEVNVNNIYSITSQENKDEPSVIKLRKEGLIYNLLYGLYGDEDARDEQTLIAALRLNDKKIISFKDTYFLSARSRATDIDKPIERTFQELYTADLYDNSTQEGVDILEKARMCLLFRVANFSKPGDSSDYRLGGRAVFLVACSQKPTTENFINFMSNEKLRLLLLVKDELLQYLQKQFDNDAFIEVLEHRNESFHQGYLRHGILDYVDAQSRLVENIATAPLLTSNIDLFNIITNAVKGQVGATWDIEKDRKCTVTKELFKKRAKLIFETFYLGPYRINFEMIDFTRLNLESEDFHPLILDVVIPELLINMKKYCPDTKEKKLSIQFDAEKKCFIFRNAVEKPSERKRGRKGQKMCNNILEEIDRPRLKIREEGLEYEVILFV